MSESVNSNKILENGTLLETSMSLAYEAANKFDFASRFAKEFGLLLMGQAIKHFNITGIKDRAYSHLALYVDPGMGKDFAWKLIETSEIFPTDIIRITRLDRVTSAALVGTISESQIVPPPVATDSIIFAGEFSTLMNKREAEEISADLRVLLETGEYSRRLAKVVGLKEVLLDPNRKSQLEAQIEKCKSMGVILDLDIGEIHVESTCSWIASSARFGCGTITGKPLLNLGDLDRFRWLSFLPTSEERRKLVAEVGSLPPVNLNQNLVNAVNEAWRKTFCAVKELSQNGNLSIPRDEASYIARKNAWEQTVEEMKRLYPEITEQHERILINLRSHSEFNRLMYQFAATKQFQRAYAIGLQKPEQFILDIEEDSAFAKQHFLYENTPGMLDVIEDVLHKQPIRRKRPRLSEIGEEIILKILQNGSKTREAFIDPIKKAGISVATLDCVILPGLIQKSAICKPKHNLYLLKQNCLECEYNQMCSTLN
jgi:hypothetical protein